MKRNNNKQYKSYLSMKLNKKFKNKNIELSKISLVIQMKEINDLMEEKNYVDTKDYYLKGL